jgi:hypothetical protein
VKTPLEFTPWDPKCIIFGFARDISFGGTFIETHFPAALGKDLVMRMWPTGWEEELILPGVVRWTCDDGMGVEFSGMGLREKSAIRKMVDEWQSHVSRPPLQVTHHAEMVRRS